MPEAKAARREAIARYERSLADVPGWLDYIDFLVFPLIDEVQDAIGIHGDILEIGAYQGRTAILLQYLCRDGERLSVCDVFEAPTGERENESERDAFYTDLTRESFERYFRRFHPTLPDIHQCRSQELEPRLRGRSFRFAHVDGSHVHAVVRGDLELVKRLLAPGGVVAIDDYRREHTPGVAAAAWDAVANGLVPICLTPGKLYGCWDGAERYAERIAALTSRDPAFRVEEHVLAGHPVVRLSDPNVVGPSREEFLAVQLAALQNEHATALAAACEAAARADAELAARAEALAARARVLEAALRRLEDAEGRIAEQSIDLAKRDLHIDDLELRIALLESALGIRRDPPAAS